MSRVWRCQSCNGNCDKGQQGGNAAVGREERSGGLRVKRQKTLFFHF